MEAVGGLGLFLLGMIIMTDGLRGLAGHSIRQALIRFTRTPTSGALTGALATAFLQSSSATTVAAVGFVSAGLLSFPSALGIVFGANIGTTITGWLVVLLGFKLKLGTLVMPLILVGAILRLFGSGRTSTVGYALAGFGLIFVGIAYMQSGMVDLQAYFSFEGFSDDTLLTRLKLVLIGAAFTVITQSSSAGVATALTALYAGAIHFEQAAALVIGMDFGTTATAAIATIGGSTDSRRTGYSHVIYNLFTATGAVLLITPFVAVWMAVSGDSLDANAEVALVAFHTLFNVLGVIAVLPFAGHFARFIEKVFVDKGSEYTGSLDRALLKDPSMAIGAIQVTTRHIFVDLLTYMNTHLGHEVVGKDVNLLRLQQAIEESLAFIDELHLGEEASRERTRFIATVHALDHLQRLARRCTETHRILAIKRYSELEDDREELVASNRAIISGIESESWDGVAKLAQDSEEQIDAKVLPLRKAVMEQVASGRFDVIQANQHLEAIRWLDRTSDHIDRICLHLASGHVEPVTEAG